jgi:D-glycerate 3-kinase
VKERPLERARPALDAHIAELGLSGAADELVDTVCAPIASAIATRVDRSNRCLIVGVSGAQGTGKSTVAGLVRVLLADGFGVRTTVVSLDDYYLPKAARENLARSEHPLLGTRGVPGTHEVVALQAALRQMRDAAPGESIQLLQFSKADDDRRRATRSVEGPFDVVLFEGWCVGAHAEQDAALIEPINALERDEDPDGRFRRFVNAQLQHAYAALWAELDMLVFLAAPDIATVHVFRREQERMLQLSAAPGAAGVMNEAQLHRFIQHFERVTGHMLRDTPGYADVVARLDAQRCVTALRVAKTGDD